VSQSAPPRSLPAAGPNAEQITYWSETTGPKWVALADLLDSQIGPLGELAMSSAALRAGERVLDVGCGCGHTSLELGRRVGARGRVQGIDISAPMLALARERAAQEGAGNVEFVLADAQTTALERGRFDLIFSRFGVMFFADPPAAFANLRRSLGAAGRLAFVCWQPLGSNPWMAIPLAAAAAHVPLPPPPPAGAPGPFAFGDPDRVARILTEAGFADVSLESVETTLRVGGDTGLEGAVRFLLEGVGPTSAALREAPDSLREKVADAVRTALAPHVTPRGVEVGAAVWIATARNA
jgi:SAM-dependent methyltransferase